MILSFIDGMSVIIVGIIILYLLNKVDELKIKLNRYKMGEG